MTLKTLAVKELSHSHTSENLIDMVEEVLVDYYKRIEDLYTFTSDNASNILKLCRMIGEAQKTMQSQYSDVNIEVIEYADIMEEEETSETNHVEEKAMDSEFDE